MGRLPTLGQYFAPISTSLLMHQYCEATLSEMMCGQSHLLAYLKYTTGTIESVILITTRIQDPDPDKTYFTKGVSRAKNQFNLNYDTGSGLRAVIWAEVYSR